SFVKAVVWPPNRGLGNAHNAEDWAESHERNFRIFTCRYGAAARLPLGDTFCSILCRYVGGTCGSVARDGRCLPATNWGYKAVFKQVIRILLFLALLWALAPSSTQAQVINCPSGFTSAGVCGVANIGSGGESFQISGTQNGSSPALVGSRV